MLTEDEAKTKWCPFARVASKVSHIGNHAGASWQQEVVATNRETVENNWPPCLGSACMAWRWARKPNPDWKPQNAQNYVMPIPRDTRLDPPMYIEDTSRGFCGLAGKPEDA